MDTSLSEDLKSRMIFPTFGTLTRRYKLYKTFVIFFELPNPISRLTIKQS